MDFHPKNRLGDLKSRNTIAGMEVVGSRQGLARCVEMSRLAHLLGVVQMRSLLATKIWNHRPLRSLCRLG